MNMFKKDSHFWENVKKYIGNDMENWANEQLDQFAELCKEIDRRAVHTDREGQPKLVKYNRLGEDISEVWLNEGYQKTIQDTYNTGIVGYPHKEIPGLNRTGNYVYSYAQGYLLSQVEPGFYCPVTLTMALRDAQVLNGLGRNSQHIGIRSDSINS